MKSPAIDLPVAQVERDAERRQSPARRQRNPSGEMLRLLVLAVTLAVLSTLPVGLAAGLPGQALQSTMKTVVLQQGVGRYTGNSNATLDLWSPTSNSGSPVATISLRPGVRVALTRFDLLSIPSNAYVSRGILSLHSLGSTGNFPLNVSAYRLSRPWRASQATWYEARRAEQWQRAGASDVTVDRAAAAIGWATVAAAGATANLDITAAVREWVHNPDSNYGALLTGSANASVAYTFGADALITADRRIKLSVTYAVSSGIDFPPLIVDSSVDDGEFVSGRVALTATVRDEGGVSFVRYLLDGSILATVTQPPYVFHWDTSGATLGRHTLVVRAKDSLKQVSERSMTVYVYRMDQGILTFAQISDTHVDPTRTGYNDAFRRGLDELNAIVNPAVILHSGDLEDAGSPTAAQLYNSIAATSRLPIVPVAGNHDLNDLPSYRLNIGPTKQWFDIGAYRFIGISGVVGESEWLTALLAGTGKTGILFSHVPLRLPAGSTLDPAYYAMNGTERATVRSLLSSGSVLGYLSGHLHQYFVFEDTSATNVVAPALGMWQSYVIATLDNGTLSTSAHALGAWPAIVVASPQQYYSDGGRETIRGIVPVRAKVYDNAPVTGVTYAVDGVSQGAMAASGGNVWQAQWDTATAAVGIHKIKVTAGDTQGRTAAREISVSVVREAAPTVTPAPTPTVTPTPAPAPYHKLVNVGGSAYTDSSGQTWVGDRPFVAGAWGYIGGSARTSGNPVTGTHDATLFETERRWPDSASPGYRFTLPNGHYEVTLRFAETALSGVDLRRFDVRIEGVPVLSGFDIVAAAEGNGPVAPDQVFAVDVADGDLAIDFIRIPGYASPLLNAIEVERIGP